VVYFLYLKLLRNTENIPTYVAFMDLEKAFDTVNRAKLWEILQNIGIPRHLIRTVQEYVYEYSD
jgi:hypothetical protein